MKVYSYSLKLQVVFFLIGFLPETNLNISQKHAIRSFFAGITGTCITLQDQDRIFFGRKVFSFGATSSGNITLVNEHSNRKMEGLKMYFLLTSINNGDFPLLLLMEEILHHLGCIKAYK